MNKEELIKEFNLISTGNKGWYRADSIICPDCNISGHIAIIFGEKNNSYNCRRCYQKGSLNKLFFRINRKDLIDNSYINLSKNELENNLENNLENKLNLETKNQNIPLGFQRIYSDEYLEKERGFIKEHFENYIIGISNEHFILKEDYIIFLVIEEGDCKGYVARSRKSKDWISLYNKKAKERNLPLYQRWRNSIAEFDKLVFGIDEIIEGITKTIIGVEGITSKANIDKLYNLFYKDDIKCIATFGKHITPIQIEKLKKKGIENFIFLFDPDAINESKKYSFELKNNMKDVKVGFLESKDPGELSGEELNKIFENLENSINFMFSKIQKNKLV